MRSYRQPFVPIAPTRSIRVSLVRSPRFAGALLLGLGIWLGTDAACRAADAPNFLREVRPILSSHCFKCHGPDAEKRKGDLRLDQRESAVKAAKSGAIAIVPGNLESSELIRRITTQDEDDLMPPAATKHPLTAAQLDVLKRWVAAGAEYVPHWAFVPPTQAEPPAVRDGERVVNAIDRFILKRLAAEGLAQSPEADPYTLLRRVALDLTGLPPTPEEADAFVNDPAADAYERLVERLLASPRYGERWARRWLDLARYADTNGYEKDRPRSIWAYRDWVIQAINSGKSFRDFTIEQMAGDILAAQLPADDPRRFPLQAATGFHRNTMINEEGGTDPQEFRFYSSVDRVHVTATTWLGLTMACAQCHTHKYDPIQHTEYYQFMALLDNADEPWIDVPDPQISRRRNTMEQEIQRLESSLAARFPPRQDIDWITPARTTFESAAGARAERLPDGSFLLENHPGDKDTYTLHLHPPAGPLSHLQLAVLPHPNLKQGGPGLADNGNFVLSEIEVTTAPTDAPDRVTPVKLGRVTADAAQEGMSPWHAADGRDDTGWGVDTGGQWHTARTLTVEFAEPLAATQPQRVTVRLQQQHGKKHLLGRLRLSLGRELPDPRPLEERRREHRERQLAAWIDRESAKLNQWTVLQPTEAKGSFPTLTIEPENTVFVSGDFTKSDIYTIKARGNWQGVTALRLEVLTDDRLPNRGPGRVNYEGPIGDFFLSDVKVTQGDQARRLTDATDSHHAGGSDAAKALDDDLQSGWSINGGQGRPHNAVFRLEKPLEGEGELTVRMLFERYYAAGLGRFRLWVTRDPEPRASALPNAVLDALLALKNATAGADRTAHLDVLRDHFVQQAPELAQEQAEIARIRRDMPRYATTLVMTERPAGHTRKTQVHKRGEFLQPGAEVEPGIPSFLPPIPDGAPRNRLGFAQWLVSAENPLTPRVVMNREWQAFFGRGLVRTMEDFGFQGELPTHPDLLDWLAVEFVKRDWSLKQMHKLIVMSATYRQSSRVQPESLAKDPENRWLARGPRLRLDAEVIRDSSLLAGGLLAERIGGPSVYPPQLASITTEGAYGPLAWTVSEPPDRYRRSLYTFAKRTAPFAMFSTFDAPSGEACVARRDRSNTPLQSLTLLNDEMFLEMARALGRRSAAESGSVEQRLERLFRRILTRPPDAGELAKLAAFHHRQSARLAAGELSATDLLGGDRGTKPEEAAAWTAVARLLLNLDEAVTRS